MVDSNGAQAVAVKTALQTGSATLSTATTLNALLHGDQNHRRTGRQPPGIRTQQPAARQRQSRPGRVVFQDGTTPDAFQRDVDHGAPLVVKAQHALAVEVVNIALHALAAATQLSRSRKRTSSTSPTLHEESPKPTQLRSCESRSASRKPCCRNAGRCLILDNECREDHITAIAECARVSFSYLRSQRLAGSSKSNVALLQVEVSALTFSQHLIKLGLYALAYEELSTVKRRLESLFQASSTAPISDNASGPTHIGCDCVPGLLLLNLEWKLCTEVWPVASMYYKAVICLISALRNPRTIERSLPFLNIERPWSSADLALQQIRHNQDAAKASRMLETLSRIILQLSPAVSEIADHDACLLDRHPSPLHAFELQTLSLSILQQMWRAVDPHAGCNGRIAKSLSKALQALWRRLSGHRLNTTEVRQCIATFEDLAGSSSDRLKQDQEANAASLRVLSSLAERAQLYDDAHRLANDSLDYVKGLHNAHSQTIASTIRQTCVVLRKHEAGLPSEDPIVHLQTLSTLLPKTLFESAVGFKLLLADLWDVVRLLKDDDKCSERQRETKVLCSRAAGFITQCGMISSEGDRKIALQIMRSALSRCGSEEALLGWVSPDAVHIFVSTGVLTDIAEKSDRMPLLRAWTSSNEAIALGRLLKILTMRSMRCSTDQRHAYACDEGSLGSDERTILLEWQFQCVVGVSRQTKYREALRCTLPRLLQALAEVYTATEHPLRRTRVARDAFRLRSEVPDLMPSPMLDLLPTSESEEDLTLSKDKHLESYAMDLYASYNISRAFNSGPLNAQALQPSLQAWQSIFKTSANPTALETRIDSPSILFAQLSSIVHYFEMLGDDPARVLVAEMLAHVRRSFGACCEPRNSEAIVARSYLSLGLAEKALGALTFSEQKCSNPVYDLEMVDAHLCRAEIVVAIENLEECQHVLEYALDALRSLKPGEIGRSRQGEYLRLRGLGWLLLSEYFALRGSHREALMAAKKAVRILSSIWNAIDKLCRLSNNGKHSVEQVPPANSLEQNMRELSLEQEQKESSGTQQRYASKAEMWSVVRLLCRALMQLANMYVHHGIFSEANYACEQATKFAKCVAASKLLSLVRSHHIQVLVLAGRAGEAHLVADDHDNDCDSTPSLIEIARLQATAAISHEDPHVAIECLNRAASMANSLRFVTTLGGIDDTAESNLVRSHSPLVITRRATKQPPCAARVAKRPTRQYEKAGARPSERKDSTRLTDQIDKSGACFLLQKLHAGLTWKSALIAVQSSGNAVSQAVQSAETVSTLPSHRWEYQRLEHELIMNKVANILQTDCTFNALQESTLAFPAFLSNGHETATSDSMLTTQTTSSDRNARKGSGRPKTSKEAECSSESLQTLLSRGRANLRLDKPSVTRLSTAEVHRRSSMLSTVTVLATAAPISTGSTSPIEAGISDVGRIFAAKAQRAVVSAEREVHSISDTSIWPDLDHNTAVLPIFSEPFEDQYVKNLPAYWSVVSLCLSEAANELYVTRYQQDQPPFVLRLPIPRQRSDEPGEETFGFHECKAELEEIIRLSNYSCHSPMDNTAKGSKTKWWLEREALDRRLGELLNNVESLWFGGFKTIFKRCCGDRPQLQRFRCTFDSILNRNLPSRRTIKHSSRRRPLNDQVLELFTGLSSHAGTREDIDEPLADLLYFVVDILAMHGERNAYDEVDFDNMAVEVQAALQTYHDGTPVVESTEREHLVLVLDKRLQAFPWENLPCLANVGASRVDSMQTLHDCLATMRLEPEKREGYHSINPVSGTYILNPSGDLSHTESTLGQELSKLASNAGWTGIVRREPSEDDLKAALATSSILLYFGHGSGSQYIRPRTLRRLDRCSKVVWLMGCSSGAVTEYGELEPVAVPLAYLGAGHGSSDAPGSRCLAVVATLWDVTDRDIDRFALTVGEEWGLWHPEPASSKAAQPGRGRRKWANLSKSESSAKTSEGHSLLGQAHTPARSRARSNYQSSMNLAQAVAKSRDVCYLRYLNGAAPVVHGIPVYVEHRG